MRLELSPSPALAAAIAASHAVAAACVFAVIPGFAGGLLAAALLALGCAAAWSRALLGAASSARAIELAGDALTVELAGGERLTAASDGRRFVSRFMVALPVRGASGGGRTILVTGAMLGSDSFRALRIWALWNRLPVAPKQLSA